MEGDAALIVPLAENRADERRLSRAVRADERDHLAAVHVKAYVGENRLAADAYAQVLHLQAARALAAARVRAPCFVHHPSASFTVSMFCRMAAK